MPSPSIEWLVEDDIWSVIDSLQSDYREDPIVVINYNPIGYVTRLEAISYFFGDDLLLLAATIIRTIIKGHPMQDGNKRLGMTLGVLFLSANGMTLTASNQSYFETALGLAGNSVDETQLLAWLKANTFIEQGECSMIAYCGIDCSKCDSYLATQSGNDEELAKIADKLSKLYHAEVKPEYVVCDGCKEGERHSYFCSNMCAMRKCCVEKHYETCIECGDFPCADLQAELDHVPDARSNLEKLRKR